MVTLRNRADHYILPYGFYLLSSFFLFPRLISAVGDWMSTILPHMVWPLCKWRLHVWNVLHEARWKYRTKKSPFLHHHTTLSGCIFAAEACIDNRKKNLLNIDTSPTYPHNTRNPLKFAGVPQTHQQISAVSRPQFTILSGHMEEVLLFNNFFPIVDTCLSPKDIAWQSCAMVPKWRFFASCISSEPHAAHFRPAF